MQVRDKFEEYNYQKKRPVAGVLLEAIQAEGGDKYASPRFFRELQSIIKEVHNTCILLSQSYHIVNKILRICYQKNIL